MTPPLSSPTSVLIHGHYYQPPREDPWLEVVQEEPSAAPWHDWNERIERECYRTVCAARILDPEGRIEEIVNLLAWTSFDVGPTLMQWLLREAPETAAAMVEGDRQARRRTGFGSAIAAPYHHVILPLASPRDRRTEIRWGIADFERRFGRPPEGMWLPEMAVDTDTLIDLADAGIRFTLLGDHQVEEAPPGGRAGWIPLPGGRRIAAFCHDGPLSHAVAFGDALRNGEEWASRLAPPADPGVRRPHRDVVAVATDGETFGHHHRFGEMALAVAVRTLRDRRDILLEPLAAALARHPPRDTLVLREPSSWSCAHGVERWRSDCGCRFDPSTVQTWRAPMRRAFDALADSLHRYYQERTEALGVDGWSARDRVPPPGSIPVDTWWDRIGALNGGDSPGATAELARLLHMQWSLLRSYTSCAWFFDDPAGLEGLQALRFVARAVESLPEPIREVEEGRLISLLEEGPLHRRPDETLADLYRSVRRHPAPAPMRIAAAAVALRTLGAGTEGEEAREAAWQTRIEGDPPPWAVTVRNGWSGTEHQFEVALDRAPPTPASALFVRAQTPDPPADSIPHPPVRIRVRDLPEPSRILVHRILRERLVPALLSPEELHPILSGSATLIACVEGKLLLEIRRLPGSTPDGIRSAVPRIEDLADLLEASGGHLPFDVQTALFQTVESMAEGVRGLLHPTLRRFGFAAPTPEFPDSGASE